MKAAKSGLDLGLLNPATSKTAKEDRMAIPYIRGTSETIARILQPYNIRVAHKR